MIKIGATGAVIRGHVLDSAVAPLVASLREYDPQLYLHWNAKKLRGWGCWEVRRWPERKTVKPEDVVVYQGNTYVLPRYHYQGMINHVMDVPFLNYSILGKIKKMDTWTTSHKGKNFTDDAEYAEAIFLEKEEDKADKEKDYMIKQHKTLIRDLMEYTNSGGNPARIADYWGQ